MCVLFAWLEAQTYNAKGQKRYKASCKNKKNIVRVTFEGLDRHAGGELRGTLFVEQYIWGTIAAEPMVLAWQSHPVGILCFEGNQGNATTAFENLETNSCCIA